MKAVVLVGGQGTRLRPLTYDQPKPLLPLMGRAFLHHVLDHLTRHGVDEVVLSSPYLVEEFEAFIRERAGSPRVTWVTEDEPLGTGGAVLNALSAIGTTESFFVLNGDILTDLDLTQMRRAHGDAGADVSIATLHVDDARPFGLIVSDAEHRISEFREKPTDLIPGDVNAGTYLIDPAVLAGLPVQAMSIERDIFPRAIERGNDLRAFGAPCYWLDLGTPEKYLRAHFDILEGKVAFEDVYEAPFVASDASIDLRAQLGRWAVILGGATVGADAEVDESVVFPDATIAPGAKVRGSVVGRGASIGAGAEILDSVIGAEEGVAPDAVLVGERIGAAPGS